MTESEADRDETLTRLQRILQALATSGENQQVLFPELVVLGKELALEFDACYQLLLAQAPEAAMPPEALVLLSEIDRVFNRMADAREHVWSGDADRESEWAPVRDLAGRALERLEWPEEEPESPRGGLDS